MLQLDPLQRPLQSCLTALVIAGIVGTTIWREHNASEQLAASSGPASASVWGPNLPHGLVVIPGRGQYFPSAGTLEVGEALYIWDANDDGQADQSFVGPLTSGANDWLTTAGRFVRDQFDPNYKCAPDAAKTFPSKRCTVWTPREQDVLESVFRVGEKMPYSRFNIDRRSAQLSQEDQPAPNDGRE